MAVTITEKAANELRRFMQEQNLPENSVFRVGVAGGGCSGFQYKIGFDDRVDQEKDHVSNQHGIQVAINKMHALHLDGTELDYYDGLEKRGFTFNNPNVVKSCGCGSSFSV